MKIFYLAPRFPYPPIRGDMLRVYHQLKLMSRSHQITFLCTAEEDVSAQARQVVEQWCDQLVIIPISAPLAMILASFQAVRSPLPLHVLYYQSRAVRKAVANLLRDQRFDLIHVALIRMFPYVWAIDQIPVVADLVDSYALNIASRRERVGPLARHVYDLEYRRVERFEKEASRHFRQVLIASAADRDFIGAPNVIVLANGVDLEAYEFRPDAREPDTLIFTGNMGYQPNEDAVTWFSRDVFPTLLAARPSLRLLIVGARPSAAVRALRASNGIEVTGAVPSVSEYLHRATIAVCPMRCGSGIQNKVLEAMATGTPVVATSLANRGVDGMPDRDILIANTSEEMCRAILGVLSEPQRGKTMAYAAHRLVAERFGWDQHAAKLEKIYAEVLHST